MAARLDKQVCQISYRDAAEIRSERWIRPLGVFYWGKVWTLAAWCESRRDFRNFRIDRIEALAISDAHFRDDAGQTLADLLRRDKLENPSFRL